MYEWPFQQTQAAQFRPEATIAPNGRRLTGENSSMRSGRAMAMEQCRSGQFAVSAVCSGGRIFSHTVQSRCCGTGTPSRPTTG
jgi:hypothetical protein